VENVVEQNESVEKLIYRVIEEMVVLGDLIGEQGPIQQYCRQRAGQMLNSCSKGIKIEDQVKNGGSLQRIWTWKE
jgi:hypothetical protein